MLICQNNFRLPVKSANFPAFKSKVDISKKAEKQTKDAIIEDNMNMHPVVEDYIGFYGDNKAKGSTNIICPDVNGIFTGLIKDLKVYTKGIGGTIMLKAGPDDIGLPTISYKAPNGKIWSTVEYDGRKLKPCISGEGIIYDEDRGETPNYDIILTDGEELIYSEFIEPGFLNEDLEEAKSKIKTILNGTNTSTNEGEIKHEDTAQLDHSTTNSNNSNSDNKSTEEVAETKQSKPDIKIKKSEIYGDIILPNGIYPAYNAPYNRHKAINSKPKVKDEFVPKAVMILNALAQLEASNTDHGFGKKNRFTKAARTALHPDLYC